MKDNKTKNKIIGISIGILVVLLVVISSTYAYWQITKSQNDPNKLVAACLDLEMTNETGSFGLVDAFPIPDEEGMTADGFTFDIVNKCNQEISYIIGMDSVKIDYASQGKNGYLSDESIKISIDSSKPVIYGTLKDAEHIEKNDPYEIRNSKEINTASISPYGRNTHNIKAWIDYNSPATEINKVFSGRVFITGGQGIENNNPISSTTPDACFEITADGEIIGYDESCGSSVVIPATINGIAVKKIDSRAFKYVEYNYDYGIVAEGSNPVAAIVYNLDKYDELKAWAERNGMGALPFYTEEPEITNGQKIQYCEDPVDGSMPLCLDAKNLFLTDETVKITGLDLSKASNLTRIEDNAFTNVVYNQNDGFDVETLRGFLNFPVSLTSLTFGNNTNEISIGSLAFARIDVDNLTLYTSYTGNPNTIKTGYFESFAMAEIDNLIIKPTSDNKKIMLDINELNNEIDGAGTYSTSLYAFISYKNLVIEEGIEEIDTTVFAGGISQTLNTGTTLTLPNSLKVIGDYAFANAPSNVVNFGTGLTKVGQYAFNGMTSAQVINVPKTQSEFESSTILGDKWSGDATINYQ